MNITLTYKLYFFPLFPVPLGGVTGLPAFNPPYGNFFLSAGFRIYKQHVAIFTLASNVYNRSSIRLPGLETYANIYRADKLIALVFISSLI